MEKAHLFLDEDVIQICMKYISNKTIACFETKPFYLFVKIACFALRHAMI